jgi:hypothetical protein
MKFHFELINAVQLIYTTSGAWSSALTWYINTAYIIAGAQSATIW